VCGLSGGEAFCWGYNARGQLGVGDTQAHAGVLQVAARLVFTNLALGGDHSCGLAVDGAWYCWGYNYWGQAGRSRDEPVITSPEPMASGIAFAELAAGDYFTCGLNSSGAVWCWGQNDQCQLGADWKAMTESPDPILVPNPGAGLSSHPCT
jgi:alpha-tubulin suppressor-like RCC1 family protein